MDVLSIWIIIGVALLVIEVLSVSFYSMFFGIGALVTAFFVYFDLADDTVTQLIIFAVSSVASIMIFRNKLMRIFHKSNENYSEIVNDIAKVSKEIPSHGEGKVFYRGADWIACSEVDAPIAKNVQVKIKKIEGIKLWVSPL